MVKNKLNYSILVLPTFVFVFLSVLFQLTSCGTKYFKNDYEDNSPTSGKLKIYYDEGLELHVKNHAFTFQSHYENANLELFSTSEDEAFQALYNDSCKVIVVSRLLNEKEKKAFDSKKLSPSFSAVAKSGVALITNINTPVDSLTYLQVIDLLTKPFVCKDSLSNDTKLNVLIDKKNSAVMHYLLDSILKGEKFSDNCNVLGASLESINFVAKNKNTIAFVDFAWLSDIDDSITKVNKNKIKFISVSHQKGSICSLPNQSSFKLGTYPFTRTIYVIRRSGDFTLGKGFETFVAGPKGQTTFLKQGLLPTKQQERSIQVNMEP
jgi:phosphate transport system substrate-binding protein